MFRVFLRLGAGAFGGPGMVAFIRRAAVVERRWVSEDEFRGGVALCEALPGATAMQVSAWVGWRVRGARGAATCFAGFGLPAVVLLVGLSELYGRVQGVTAAVAGLRGLQVVAVAVVASAAVSFGRSYLRGARPVAVAAAAGVLLALGLHPIVVVVLAATAGAGVLRRHPLDAPADQGEARRPEWRTVALVVGTFALLIAALALVAPRLFHLAALMARIDLFAFGGGFASLPIMFHEVVARHWMTARMFLDGVALGQVTPGPMVVTATFVGFAVGGYAGAAVATVAVFVPSFVVLLGAAPYASRLAAQRRFAPVVAAVASAFVGLLAATAWQLAAALAWDVPRLVLVAGAFVALRRDVDVLWVVGAAALFSVLVL